MLDSAKGDEASGRQNQVTRVLTDYRNADGQVPDGVNDGADDSHALRTALAVGPGLVLVPPGSYRFGEVTVPPGVTLHGAGHGTVVRLARGAKRIFLQKGVSDWRLRDMLLDGGAAPESWLTRQDLGETGIDLSGCNGFEISGLAVNNFNGAGIQIAHTAASPYCPWATAANVFNIAAGGNHTGIRFDTRAEYMNASLLTCYGNVIGCTIHGGNVKVANSNFTNNLTGMLIEDHDNGSHGMVSNCLVNHNQQLALLARDVANGMGLDNCAFFCGGIHLVNSKGINITSSIIACSVKTVGDGVNRIAGNYVITGNESFDFSPLTILEGNFTDRGPWERNRRIQGEHHDKVAR